MQKIIVSLFLVVTFFTVNAQNVVHDANAQVRSVSSFNTIKISSAISLYLSQGNTQAVAVSAEDDNAASRIKTEVKNGMLNIYVENGAWNGWNWGNKHLRAYVTFTELQMLEASGACNVEFTDPATVNDFKLVLSGASNLKGELKGNDVDFDLNGASNAKLDVTSTSFKISQSGASNFKGSVKSGNTNFDLNGASVADVDGSATDLIISASGASNFKGGDLQSTNCKIQATGASSCNISVNKELDATATGASSIHYFGDATITNIDVSGGSTIKKKS